MAFDRGGIIMAINVAQNSGICTLTIDRPAVRNAVDTQALTEFDRVLTEIAGNGGCRVVIITGAGRKAFCSGADVRELKGRTYRDAYTYARLGQVVCQKIQDLVQPTIAAIGLDTGCRLEASLFALCFGREQEEGMEAFLDKGTPAF